MRKDAEAVLVAVSKSTPRSTMRKVIACTYRIEYLHLRDVDNGSDTLSPLLSKIAKATFESFQDRPVSLEWSSHRAEQAPVPNATAPELHFPFAIMQLSLTSHWMPNQLFSIA